MERKNGDEHHSLYKIKNGGDTVKRAQTESMAHMHEKLVTLILTTTKFIR